MRKNSADISSLHLTVTYLDSDGEQTDREISRISLLENARIQAFCHERRQTRTFRLLGFLKTIDANTGEEILDPWALFGLERPPLDSNTRRLYRKVIPSNHFSGWHFSIGKHHWPALGVTRRQYIDREKTKALRLQKLAEGVPESEKGNYKVTYDAHVVAEPPFYEFSEGDLFNSLSGGEFVQVVAVVSDGVLEVHHGWLKPGAQRHGYHITDTQFPEWLRTGTPPAVEHRIAFGVSESQSLRYLLEPPPPLPTKHAADDAPAVQGTLWE